MNRAYAVMFVLVGCLCIGSARSPKWGKVRDSVVEATPWCGLCGAEKKLEAHHIQSFRVAPELELATNNLVVLCRHCHFQCGHGGISWKYENTNIMQVLSFRTGEILYKQREIEKCKR